MARTEIEYILAKSVAEDFKFGLVPLESFKNRIVTELRCETAAKSKDCFLIIVQFPYVFTNK